MKFALMAAAALSMVAGSAFAQAGNSASTTLNLSADVGKLCGAGGHGSSTSNTSTTAASQNVPVTGLVNSDGFVVAQTINLNGNPGGFGNLWCNTPSTITLTVNPLTNPTPVVDTTSFFNVIDLKVTAPTAYLGVGNNVVTTAGAQASATAGLAAAFESGTGLYDDVSIDIIAPTQDRPIAGTYTGSVVLSVSAS